MVWLSLTMVALERTLVSLVRGHIFIASDTVSMSVVVSRVGMLHKYGSAQVHKYGSAQVHKLTKTQDHKNTSYKNSQNYHGPCESTWVNGI